MLNKVAKKLISVVGLTTIALSSQAAYAKCSDNTDTIIQSSSAIAAIIPSIGVVSSAGLALSSLFGCGPADEPLEVAEVINLILTEFDNNAAIEAEGNVRNAVISIKGLAELMQTDERFGDNQDIRDLNAEQRGTIIDRIDRIIGDINNAETSFFASLVTSNDSRESYDIAPAIVLANYKIGLMNFSAALSQNEGGSTFINETAQKILDDFAEYQQESDRLRDIDISVGTSSSRYDASATVKFERNGTLLFKETFSCIKNPFLDPCNTNVMRERADRFALRKGAEIFSLIDEQDTQIALLTTKAEALIANNTANLAEVTATTETSVLIGNFHDNAINRCIYAKDGQLNKDESLSGGIMRLKDCNPVVSRQQWLLKDNGQIRSVIADLCITANSDNNKISTRKCAINDGFANFSRQVWTRMGEHFTVNINGETRCLSPRPNHVGSTDYNLRHLPCENKPEHSWLAFSTLENGKISKQQALGFGPFSVATVDALGLNTDDVTEDSLDELRLCVATGELNERIGLHEPELIKCNRFNPDSLWAQDSQGRFRPLLNRKMVLDGYLRETPMQLTNEIGSGSEFVKDELLIHTLEDNSEVLFADSQTEHSAIFTGVFFANEDGRTEDAKNWQHFNGGKLDSSFIP